MEYVCVSVVDVKKMKSRDSRCCWVVG